MENLGTMEPEEILQLFTGSFACAFVIFVFIIGYVFISRRGNKSGGPASSGSVAWRKDTLSASRYPEILPDYKTSIPFTSSDAASPGSHLSEGEVSSYIDVSARLTGTGREAWLEEGTHRSVETPTSQESVSHEGREILRLLRDPLTGHVWVQVAGVRYRTLRDIRDRKVGERVLAAITHLLRFSNGMVAADQGVMTLGLPPCDAVKMPTPFGVLSEAYERGELIRLMSNPARDHFCVHVAGHCFRRLLDVKDRETGQYILEAVTRLLQFSDGLLATNDGVGLVPVPPLASDVRSPLPSSLTPEAQNGPPADLPGQPMPASGLRLAQPPVVPSDPGPPLSEQERFLQQLAGQTPLQSKLPPVERPSLIGSLRRMRQSSSADLLPSLNLADEIDRIFQSKLLASGLATTDASVEAKPDGSVCIRVEAKYYDSPDEVPDPYLRDLLKLSIAEWERS